MKDPLTKKEKSEFLKAFEKEFNRQYSIVFKAIQDEISEMSQQEQTAFQKGSCIIAKIALSRAAQEFRLFSNYKHLIKRLDTICPS
jgi:hypothetical protein